MYKSAFVNSFEFTWILRLVLSVNVKRRKCSQQSWREQSGWESRAKRKKYTRLSMSHQSRFIHKKSRKKCCCVGGFSSAFFKREVVWTDEFYVNMKLFSNADQWRVIRSISVMIKFQNNRASVVFISSMTSRRFSSTTIAICMFHSFHSSVWANIIFGFFHFLFHPYEHFANSPGIHLNHIQYIENIRMEWRLKWISDTFLF